jgi:hypothetical protein
MNFLIFYSFHIREELKLLNSDDILDSHWVTVFGFPPNATSYIIEQFSQYGTIIRHEMTSEGNWVHLQYQTKLQARKALSKNGKVYGEGVMVGVQPCIAKVSISYKLVQWNISNEDAFPCLRSGLVHIT